MVSKKTKKSDLENKKVLFFEIGISLALAASLVAFEWNTAPGESSRPGEYHAGEDIEELVSTPRSKNEPPPPPPPQMPEEIFIVKNDIEFDEFEFAGTDINESTPINIVYWEPAEEHYIDSVLLNCSDMPRYNGGDLLKFRNFIQSVVKYPEQAIKMRIQGKVFVRFVVKKTGTLGDIQILGGTDPVLNNAVIAALQKSDKWLPGLQNGIPVNVAMTMPVVFKLQ